MKHWYDYQLKNQVVNFDWQDSAKPIDNLKEEIAPWVAELKSKYSQGDLDKEDGNFFSENYANDIECPGIETAEIKKLLFHPDYKEVVDQSNIDRVVIPNNMRVDIEEFSCKRFNFVPGTISMGIQLQHPGQFVLLHIDRPKFHDYKIPLTDLRQDPISAKILIFFDDWQDGQTFQMGKEFIKWKAGDVYTWNQRDVPHGSANFGFESRWILRITGMMTS
jgi:hypothetical protein